MLTVAQINDAGSVQTAVHELRNAGTGTVLPRDAVTGNPVPSTGTAPNLGSSSHPWGTGYFKHLQIGGHPVQTAGLGDASLGFVHISQSGLYRWPFAATTVFAIVVGGYPTIRSAYSFTPGYINTHPDRPDTVVPPVITGHIPNVIERVITVVLNAAGNIQVVVGSSDTALTSSIPISGGTLSASAAPASAEVGQLTADQVAALQLPGITLFPAGSLGAAAVRISD